MRNATKNTRRSTLAHKASKRLAKAPKNRKRPSLLRRTFRALTGLVGLAIIILAFTLRLTGAILTALSLGLVYIIRTV